MESYLDFHGNKFSRRFDANSYICLVQAMTSPDIGRDRGGAADALGGSRRAVLSSASTATGCSPFPTSISSPIIFRRR